MTARAKGDSERTTLDGVLTGAIAGAIATWLMGMATSYLYEHESKQAHKREDAARGGSNAYATAAEKAADLAGKELSDEQKKSYGTAIHWSLGIASAALYGAVRHELPIGNRLARGLAFGTSFWLVMDEAVTPLAGLTPGPSAFPWQTHARGLAGHLVFGATTEAVLALLH